MKKLILCFWMCALASAETTNLPQTVQSLEGVARQTSAQAYLFDVKAVYQSGLFLNVESGFVVPGDDENYLLVRGVGSLGKYPFVLPPPPGGTVPIFPGRIPTILSEPAQFHPELKGWDLRPDWIAAATKASGLKFTNFASVEVTSAIHLKRNANFASTLSSSQNSLSDDAPIAVVSSHGAAPAFGFYEVNYVIIDATNGTVIHFGSYKVYPPRPVPGAVHSGGLR